MQGGPSDSRSPINKCKRMQFLYYETGEVLFKEYHARLNHLMLLNIYKELLDNIDLTQSATEFVRNSEHRQHIFGNF